MAVARRIQQRHRATVIFVTDYPRSALRVHIGDLAVADCLRKPISLAALAESVGAANPVPATAKTTS